MIKLIAHIQMNSGDEDPNPPEWPMPGDAVPPPQPQIHAVFDVAINPEGLAVVESPVEQLQCFHEQKLQNPPTARYEGSTSCW